MLIKDAGFRDDIDVVEVLHKDMATRGIGMDLTTINALIGIYGRLGRTNKARKLHGEIRVRGLEPNNFTDMALVNRSFTDL